MQSMLFLRLSLLSDWQQIANDAAVRLQAQDDAIQNLRAFEENAERKKLLIVGENPNTAPTTTETLKQSIGTPK